METLFSMKGIEKSFGKVDVLHGCELEVKKGEIHALMGENGAGKSTLMNILGGVFPKDAGTITFEGKEMETLTPNVAEELGIGFVHQELNLAEDVTVAENVFIARLPYKNKALGIVDWKKLNADTEKYLNIVGAHFKPTDKVVSLSTANKQLVEIAKALSLNAKVIIFDEPTTSLSNADVDVLFIVIRALRDKGISSIYISHRMAEIFELCERITIMRDGTYISTDYVKDLTNDEIIQKLVGRSLDNLYPKDPTEIGDVHLAVKDLRDRAGVLKGVSFNARKGEVVGFAGLVGAGRTEIMRLLFGADRIGSGEILIDGKKIDIKSPLDAVAHKICLLTEDRKHQGLALSLSICDNINVTNLPNFVLNHKTMAETADKYIKDVTIKVADKFLPASSLSGGNQQKVVIGKWLNSDSDIYIFDEPTKGIDVGAKSEIYQIINDLAKQGKTIIIVSSEIPELLGVTDRIYVVREGKITGEVKTSEATQESIMTFATMEDEK
ncbi:monosaccharide-transporting ATPase [Lactococcus hodotermopsidis]|uniref:Monosaccharide-transporting ATPase n=1 Tax=Pseudolactococcus hodotermopsidis TaxID=2709157 RepID=A0A6A0B9K4_9LACT|nr:sugar ABC transporter ATP-binding protein [Lactococcus hodotermopsidis]GFH42052.1 monosaccharide-transporting ATPase [Lactococcus hodotermopsidis]